MDCRELQEYIYDRILGEDLPGPVEEKLEEHLGSCRRCRRRLQEAESAWSSLEVLEKVRFPESLSRRVLAAVATRPLKLLDRVLYPPWPALAAASLILAAGLLLIFSRSRPPGPQPLRSASTFARSPVPGPDLAATLDGYLEESETILAGLESGDYATWGALLAEIVSRDIQGRSNYLLENEMLDRRARSVVESLHRAFWSLLQTGRGREDEMIRIPPGVNPALLRSEIVSCRTTDRR
ncbi:MAG: zf-HC2 domain-containing protein [Candidatus Erginobacter occultus]|nr:zf-HC2 domain-containing protein [Candidatus Erginobacter occultus]